MRLLKELQILPSCLLQVPVSAAFFPVLILLASVIALRPTDVAVAFQEAEQFEQSAEKGAVDDSAQSEEDWSQWRGNLRTGHLKRETNWPDSVSESAMEQLWSVKLGPGYSGPIVVGDRVFAAETKDQKYEVVTAFDRTSGKPLWSARWEGAMSVPFFARANGSWIRSTPTYEDGRLYVGGMRDVLVCLHAETGDEIWRIDFPSQVKSELPTFGYVSSPLIEGDFLYTQAGGGFCKINKHDGQLVWRTLVDGGGMNGSAFSSPVLAELAGVKQVVVQTRTDLCGIDIETGDALWKVEIPTFRGMNILTPTVLEAEDTVFVSSYGGTTQLLKVSRDGDKFTTTQVWNNGSQGYMNSPVVIDNHVYMHLRNQRFACYDLKTGAETWRSKPMGKYASMIANGDKILALDERGELLLIKANSDKFELLSSRKVGDDSWAHLAIRGNQVYVRNLDELIVLDWKSEK